MAKLKSGTRIYGSAVIDSLLEVGTVNKVTITSPASSATLTLAEGSTLATSGAFITTLTSTGSTNVTLPTSGTLATTAGTLSSATNSTQNGYFGDIFLYDDSTPSHYLGITNSANLTAARTLSINVNDANRTISLSGNLTVSSDATISGTNTGNQTITLTGDVTGSGTGSFAATIAADAVTYAKIQNVSATDRILGRSSAGAGDIQEITCTAAGRALLDDVDAAAQRTTLGLGTIATQASSNVSITGGSITGLTSLEINGAIGLSGANYGTAGQVLTSSGSGAAPTWQSSGGGVDTIEVMLFG